METFNTIVICVILIVILGTATVALFAAQSRLDPVARHHLV